MKDGYVIGDLYALPEICTPVANKNIEFGRSNYKNLINITLDDYPGDSSNLKTDMLIGGDFYSTFITGNSKTKTKRGGAVMKL